MNTHELTECFSAENEPQNTRISRAIAYLDALSDREDGMVSSETVTLEACTRMITGLDVEAHEKKLFAALARYMKTSPAFQSADYLEDYFDFHFETTDPSFEVDYTGKYTFVPDLMLPEPFVHERACLLMLARFYFEQGGPSRHRANLEGVAFPGLELSTVEVSECGLAESILMGGVFKDCRFASVSLRGANLKGCTFTGCRFEDVNLNECLLEGATFTHCIFEGSSLWDTCLDKVTFHHCRFVQVQMWATDFGGTDLESSLFEACWVSCARLYRVNGIDQTQLASFFGDDSTRLPAHIERPSFWPRKGDITTWRRWVDTGDVIESSACIEYE